MLAFSSAHRALDCDGAIQRAFDAEKASLTNAVTRVRIRSHTRKTLEEADDFHGKRVVLAAHCEQHRARDVLVSSLAKS